MKIERVAAYIRVSTTEQKLHGLSLDAQKMKLEKYAKENSMKIVEWYMDEGVSGRKLIRNRPELQRMILDAKQDKFERIIFIKLDRFFRSVAEYHECMKQITPVTWTTTEEDYDLTTANGRMLVNMKLTIAELEADQTGERINIVNDYKTSTGQPLTGSMPFGFMIVIDENTGRKKIVKNPEHEEIMEDLIRHLFKYHSKRRALTYIHAKHHVSMPYNSLTKLINNTMLCGEYRNNKNYNEPYMTREQFDTLQNILNRNVKDNSPNRDYIFSGLIKCPVCGHRLAGAISRQKSTNGTVHKYKKYRCANFRLNRRCTFNKSVTENILERQLLANVKKYLEEAKIENAKIREGNVIKTPKYNVDDINEQIDRLNYSWRTGRIKKVEDYDKQYDELVELLDKAENECLEPEHKDFSKVEEVLQAGWMEIYDNLDDAHKRAFWRSFISSIEVNWTTEIKEIVKVNFFNNDIGLINHYRMDEDS